MIDVDIAVELWIGKLKTIFNDGVFMIPPPIPNKFAVNPAKMNNGIDFLKFNLLSWILKKRSIWLISWMLFWFFDLFALYIMLNPATNRVNANISFNIELSTITKEKMIVARILPSMENPPKSKESLSVVLFCRK